MIISYSSLRDIQKKEVESAAIQTLENNFYEQVAEFLIKKKHEILNSKSILTIKEYENIKKIILSIQSKREEKIILMALRGEYSHDGLTKEEKMMLKNLADAIKESRDTMKEILHSDEREEHLRKVRMLKDIETYKGLDNTVYGPFKTGDEHLLPQNEVEWLIKSKMAELI